MERRALGGNGLLSKVYKAVSPTDPATKRLLALCADESLHHEGEPLVTPKTLMVQGSLNGNTLEKHKKSIMAALRDQADEDETFQGNKATQQEVQEYSQYQEEKWKQIQFIEKTITLLQHKESLTRKPHFHPIAQHQLNNKNKSIQQFSIEELHQKITTLFDSLNLHVLGPSFGEMLINKIVGKKGFTPQSSYHLGRALDSSGYLCAVVNTVIPGQGNTYIQLSNDHETIAQILTRIRATTDRKNNH